MFGCVVSRGVYYVVCVVVGVGVFDFDDFCFKVS